MNSGQIFVLSMIAISMLGGVFSMWVKAWHGYPLHDLHGGRAERRRRRHGGEMVSGDALEAERKVLLLSGENERLTGQVSRLEERIAVLERIATDPAERVSREIDALR